MKAMVYRGYGSPDVLRCENVDKPIPGDDEVLVRIRAAAARIGPLPYLIKLLVSSPLVSQKVIFFIARVNREALGGLKALIETNQVTPVIGRCYPLSEASEALRYLKQGHPGGKVVIAVESETKAAT